MGDQIQDLDSLQQIFEHKIEEIHILFLDLSSSCTGYTVVKLDFLNKKATFKKAGAIWFNQDWKNQEKYAYLFNAIVNYFNIIDQVDFCVCEAYMLNPKKRMGSLVGPELHGAVQVALAEIGVTYMTMPVQTWRKHLGIKKDASGDYKNPTKIEIEKYTTLPTEIISNITGSTRALPNDLVDALGIAAGSLKKWGINNLDFSKIEFQSDIGVLE
jgi:Holliday junction resolvasome RuvABC endonuclease subunit